MSIDEDSLEPGSSESCSESSNTENIPPAGRIKEDEFSWQKFFEQFGGHPSCASVLWPHCNAMERQIFDALFTKGLMLFVEKNGAVRLASIVLSLGLECSVEYQDVSFNDSEWVSLAEIVIDPIRAKELQENVQKKVKTPLNFVNMEDVNYYSSVLEMELHTAIKPGQYFELQEINNPDMFSIVKVIENYCGIIVYSTLGEEKELGTVHIQDRRCYPLGWVSSHSDECYFNHSSTSTDVSEMYEQRVPSICFNSGTETHSFQMGNLIEVLDENTGLFTYPGYISEILCSRFAIADVYTNKQLEPMKIFLSKYTEGVYPKDFSHQHKLQMQNPMAFSKFDQSFTWSDFKNLIKQPKAVSALESSLPKPNQTRIHSQQYVEYFNYDLCVMTPALIVRSKMDSIWLLTGLNRTSAQSVHAFIGKPSIFPVGFAEKYKIPFCALSALPYCLPPERTPSETNGTKHGSRFYLEQFFKSIPAPVFRKPHYSGRGRPERNWQFMTELHFKDNWLPQVSIVRTCRLGSWLDPKLFANLNDHFPYGNISDVIDTIVKDFFRCTKPEFRNEVVAALDVSDASIVCPKQVVKFRWKAEGWMITIVACEKCEGYPGWLRNFLSSYGCCPNLLTIKRDQVIPCQEGCDTVVEPVLSPVQNYGKRPLNADGTRKRGRRDGIRPGRGGQTFIGGEFTLSRSQRLPGAIDVPEYTTWNKAKLFDYLSEQNPSLMILLRQFFAKSASVAEILQCRDIMTISRFGYMPKDAARIHEALENLRSAYR